MTQGGYQVIIILLVKSKMAAAKKQCFFAISAGIELSLHPRHSKSGAFK